jgi:hypothetical protein
VHLNLLAVGIDNPVLLDATPIVHAAFQLEIHRARAWGNDLDGQRRRAMQMDPRLGDNLLGREKEDVRFDDDSLMPHGG